MGVSRVWSPCFNFSCSLKLSFLLGSPEVHVGNIDCSFKP